MILRRRIERLEACSGIPARDRECKGVVLCEAPRRLTDDKLEHYEVAGQRCISTGTYAPKDMSMMEHVEGPYGEVRDELEASA